MRRAVNWWNGLELKRRKCVGRRWRCCSEPETDADTGVVITFLGNDAVSSCLGILKIIPDKRSIQIEMPLDLVFQRGHRVMSIFARLRIGKLGVQRLDERKPLGDINAET